VCELEPFDRSCTFFPRASFPRHSHYPVDYVFITGFWSRRAGLFIQSCDKTYELGFHRVNPNSRWRKNHEDLTSPQDIRRLRAYAAVLLVPGKLVNKSPCQYLLIFPSCSSSVTTCGKIGLGSIYAIRYNYILYVSLLTRTLIHQFPRYSMFDVSAIFKQLQIYTYIYESINIWYSLARAGSVLPLRTRPHCAGTHIWGGSGNRSSIFSICMFAYHVFQSRHVQSPHIQSEPRRV